eukprot:2179773-Amphidinium_carterae.1
MSCRQSRDVPSQKSQSLNTSPKPKQALNHPLLLVSAVSGHCFANMPRYGVTVQYDTWPDSLNQ